MATISVGVLAGGFDDRLPACNLAFELRLQGVWRGIRFRGGLGSEFGEACCYVLVLERKLERLGETLHSLRRCALRCIDAVPDADLKVRETGFGLLCPSGSPEALAAALESALRRREELRPDPALVARLFSPAEAICRNEELLTRVALAGRLDRPLIS